jgi:hypothetical protein
MKLNIYEFNWGDEKDWVIAGSKKRAIEIHHNTTDIEIEEYKDRVSFVKKKDWDNYNYWETSPDNTMTFKEYMENESPNEDMFCSTVY